MKSSGRLPVRDPEPRVVATLAPSRTTAARRRTYLWIALVLVGVLLLGGLAYAETVWLHEDLPQDRVSRRALVIYPNPAPAGPAVQRTAVLRAAWSQRLVAIGSDTRLGEQIIARLNLRDPSTGRRLTPSQLLGSMTITSQCIAVNLEEGANVPGLLLINVVRGARQASVERIADEWSSLFQHEATGAFPGLVVQPVETLRGTYEICH